ncbi:MAG: SMR family transporter [Deltaproteobacteria bacterium]|nr:SMR family transporter [Deltaproteobacteria bacterium]
MNWIILLSLVVVNAIAGVFVKLGSLKRIDHLFHNILNTNYLLGLFFYGLSFILFALALKKLPLNVVHPISTGGTVALVAILAVIFLNEQLRVLHFLGMLLIIVGICLITWR